VEIPKIIGGADVVIYTTIDEKQFFTNDTSVFYSGSKNAICGLAVCKYNGHDGYYLFGCDKDWSSLTDTWHEKIEDAKEQAESDYIGINETWKSINED